MKVLLIAYDNGSHIHSFPIGLAYIAAVLRKEAHEVVIYSQDKYHYRDEDLTVYLDKNKFDVVGIGVIAGYYQYRKLLSISEAINKSKNRPFYIIGGHGPSPEPEFFIKKTAADAVVIGEGEETIVELMNALAGRKAPDNIKGIAFRRGKTVIVNARRPLISQIDKLLFPAYDLFPIDYYALKRVPHASNNDRVMDIVSGRGCNFKCSFCYRMDEGFRPRSNSSIIDEIKYLKKEYSISYIIFQDDLLMSSAQRTVKLCEDFIKNNLGVKWNCNGRLNYAEPKILKLMKRAGCVFVNYGIEAMDDKVLKNMNKALTTKQVVNGVEATFEAGISPGLNIIFGNIGDSRQTLKKAVEFLLKYDDGVQLRTIRPVTPYPGSPLYYYAIEKGLLNGCEDFYENKHINSDLLSVNFTDMDDDEFHRALMDANSALAKNYFRKKSANIIEQARRLYLDKDVGFRGFRQT